MTNAKRARKRREKNKERLKEYQARWREKNKERLKEYQARWRKANPERFKLIWKRNNKAQWLKIIDSYERHEAFLLKMHNAIYPDKPYRPNYKTRRPPTWMMHRALWEYAGGEPTPEQKAYAIALFRSRRAQRYGEREVPQ